MKHLAGIGYRAISWLVVAVIVLGSLGAVALVAAPRAMGLEGKIILSGSMEPALQTGGMAFMERVDDPAAIEAGDIITFRSQKDPTRLISHRVTNVLDDAEGLRFETKGDNSPAPDQTPVPAANLVGIVRYDLPYLGYVAERMRDPRDYYLILGVPAGILILSEMMNIAREVRKQRAAGAAS